MSRRPLAWKVAASILTVGLASLSVLPYSPAAANPPTISGSFSFDPQSASAVCDPLAADSPFVLPAGFSQSIIASEASDPDFLERSDMNQVNETGAQVGRFLYRSHELTPNSVTPGAGVSVTDLETGDTTILARRADWERFDGLKWTPWRTLLVAEEVVTAVRRDPDYPSATSGLVYEINPETGEVVARPALGSKSHEGIGIDPAGNIYGIDEFASGGIYKFVPDRRADLSSGQLYVLK
ncbi:MAG: phosphatase, partial [Dehalococcoidia bacterium]|nr:phosphatase [Dehalococcoidia bacterium]